MRKWMVLVLVFVNYYLNAHMSLDEKVGQLFIGTFQGDELNENVKRLIRETKIGGIIYFDSENDLSDYKKVRKMSSDLQRFADEEVGIPLWISVDQEGGVVARFKEGFTDFPGNGALGAIGDSELAFEVAKAIGQELRAVGVNMNLAPVVDVNINPENPIIGIRSFGDDSHLVTRLGRESLRGFKEAKVTPCLKHFPGHGDVTVDSHLALPIVNKELEELKRGEFVPFEALDAPSIMTAHILYEKLDNKNCATLSEAIIEGILRKNIGYDGVVMTDSLTMQGVLEGNTSMGEVAIRALDAGNDILLFGKKAQDNEHFVGEIIQAYQEVLHAVKTGRLSEERIDASLKRILRAKDEAGLFSWENGDERVIGCEEHLSLAKEIAKRAVSIKNGTPFPIGNKVLFIAPEFLGKKMGELDGLCTFAGLEPTEEEVKDLMGRAQEAESLVFFSYNLWKFPRQHALLEALAEKTPTVCVACGSPYDLEKCVHPKCLIATYSPSTASLEEVISLLKHSQ